MDSTAYVNVTVSNKQAENRTSPVYVAELGKLSLQDILEKKPDNMSKDVENMLTKLLLSYYQESYNIMVGNKK